MLYLRDEFPTHPKFDGWEFGERWCLLELMIYLSRYDSRGRIPPDRSLLPRNATDEIIEKAKASGWIDVDEHGTEWFHKWPAYNGASRARAGAGAHARERASAGAVQAKPVEASVSTGVGDTTPPAPPAALEGAPPAPASSASFVCSECGLELKNAERLQEHVENVHGDDPPRTELVGEEFAERVRSAISEER